MVGEAGNVVVGGIVLAMMAACLYCARELWVGSSVRAWCLVALMNLGMIAIHWSAPGCHPARAASVSPAHDLDDAPVDADVDGHRGGRRRGRHRHRVLSVDDPAAVPPRYALGGVNWLSTKRAPSGSRIVAIRVHSLSSLDSTVPPRLSAAAAEASRSVTVKDTCQKSG